MVMRVVYDIWIYCTVIARGAQSNRLGNIAQRGAAILRFGFCGAASSEVDGPWHIWRMHRGSSTVLFLVIDMNVPSQK